MIILRVPIEQSAMKFIKESLLRAQVFLEKIRKARGRRSRKMSFNLEEVRNFDNENLENELKEISMVPCP